MTLTELRYFVALARERHFGRAAEKSFVSQPTLSVAIKRLEDELGVVLFERGSGEVKPTPVGENLVAQAAVVLAEAARFREMAAAGKDPLAGALRLGAIPTIGPWLLPRLVPLVKSAAPAMPLLLEESFTHVLIEKLKAGDLDIAVLALPIVEAGLVTRPVYDEEFRVLVPADHPWAARTTAIAPAELLDQPLLMLGAGNCFRDQVFDLCAVASRESGASPRVLEGGSLETIRQMVVSGVGISVMPATAVDGATGAHPLLSVLRFADPQPGRRVGMVWRASYPRHRALDVLLHALLGASLPGTRALS